MFEQIIASCKEGEQSAQATKIQVQEEKWDMKEGGEVVCKHNLQAVVIKVRTA